MSWRPPRKRDLATLSKEQLVEEIEKLELLILKVTVAPREVEGFTEFQWIAGTAVVGLSIVFGGPLGLVGLLSAGAGLGLIGASILYENGKIKGDVEIAALIDKLSIERASLRREYDSRP